MRGVPGLGTPRSELGRGPKLRAHDDGDALGFGKEWPRAGGSEKNSVGVAALHLVGVCGVQAA